MANAWNARHFESLLIPSLETRRVKLVINQFSGVETLGLILVRQLGQLPRYWVSIDADEGARKVARQFFDSLDKGPAVLLQYQDIRRGRLVGDPPLEDPVFHGAWWLDPTETRTVLDKLDVKAHEVLLAAGAPCCNVTGTNRAPGGRVGLAGEKSGLWYHFASSARVLLGLAGLNLE